MHVNAVTILFHNRNVVYHVFLVDRTLTLISGFLVGTNVGHSGSNNVYDNVNTTTMTSYK